MSGYDTEPQYFSLERYNSRKDIGAKPEIKSEVVVEQPGKIVEVAPVAESSVIKSWVKSSTTILGMRIPNWLLLVVLVVLTYYLVIMLQEKKVIPTILGPQTAILSTETPAALRNITGGLY